ncbi:MULTISPECIES: glycosyltransferase family 2 protein [Enterococcus]|uniref:glycosyltransferase family 2 protein n=1 Tax=Enterococcus TaxID=1350 RepID=UPI000ECE19D4|nr:MULTISPECIES: glycosyltransferase family 2 protein [Enterococcus]HCM85211.1 hypothetical protein [Enterococcus sp.]
MDISVIVPFYRGFEYIEDIKNSFEDIYHSLNKKSFEVEFIVVNDSPDFDLRESHFNAPFCVEVLSNNRNRGIHYSRVKGLKRSRGEYVLFLDQDDQVSGKKVLENYMKIRSDDTDVVISNGYFEFSNGDKKPIFTNNFYKKKLVKEFYYLNIKDLIISPGQCLIKSNSIPLSWKENIIINNGTDDYMLWLLMFDNNKKFIYNDVISYFHNDSGRNLSFDIDKWIISLKELEDTLSFIEGYPNRKVHQLKKTNDLKISFVKSEGSSLIRTCIKQPRSFLINLIFRLINGATVIQGADIRKNHRKNQLKR